MTLPHMIHKGTTASFSGKSYLDARVWSGITGLFVLSVLLLWVTVWLHLCPGQMMTKSEFSICPWTVEKILSKQKSWGSKQNLMFSSISPPPILGDSFIIHLFVQHGKYELVQVQVAQGGWSGGKGLKSFRWEEGVLRPFTLFFSFLLSHVIGW